jgi:hypothetical protein
MEVTGQLLFPAALLPWIELAVSTVMKTDSHSDGVEKEKSLYPADN